MGRPKKYEFPRSMTSVMIYDHLLEQVKASGMVLSELINDFLSDLFSDETILAQRYNEYIEEANRIKRMMETREKYINRIHEKEQAREKIKQDLRDWLTAPARNQYGRRTTAFEVFREKILSRDEIRAGKPMDPKSMIRYFEVIYKGLFRKGGRFPPVREIEPELYEVISELEEKREHHK